MRLVGGLLVGWPPSLLAAVAAAGPGGRVDLSVALNRFELCTRKYFTIFVQQ